MTTKKRDTSYFLIQIDHPPTASPKGIAAGMVIKGSDEGCYELKVIDVDGFSKKQFPYIAE